MNRLDAQRGSTLLYLIFVMLALSGFSYALLSVNSASVQSELLYDRNQKAYYLALAGINYTESYKGVDLLALDGANFAANGSGTDRFSLQVQQTPDLTMLVLATGIANSGQSSESRVTLHKEVKASLPSITFKDDFDDFGVITSDSDKFPVIKNNSNKNFSIGGNQNYAFGGMYYKGTKTLPANKCAAGECDFKLGMRVFFTFHFDKTDGQLADGFNFVIFNADNNDTTSIGGDSAMGEMLGYAGDSRVYNGSNGDYGDGTIKKWLDPNRKGISPPKMAVEFDPFTNAGIAVCPAIPIITGTSNKPYELTKSHIAKNNNFPSSGSSWSNYWKLTACKTATPSPWAVNKDIHFPDQTVYTDGTRFDDDTTQVNRTSSTRADPTKDGYTHLPHVAFMFWGDDSEDMTCKYRYGTCIPNTTGYLFKKSGSSDTTTESSSTATYAGMQTYNDNKHGSGLNSGNAPGDYFEATGNYDWKTGKSFAFRFEVIRGQTAVVGGTNNGKYKYDLTCWIKPCVFADCSDQLSTRFWDTSRYYKVPGDIAALSKTVYLNATDHTKMDKVIFGYTEATGGATQNATIEQLILQFIQAGDKDITSLN